MSAVIVHGGAGSFRNADRASVLAGVRRAAFVAWSVLEAGGPAIEAVEAATRTLEDDPLFNAGYGSSLNEEGAVETDAMIMDGRDLELGAVAAVPQVRHPVTLARLVMTDCPHHLLVGKGAEIFARERGLVVPVPDVMAPSAVAEWSEHWAGRGAARVVGEAAEEQDASAGPPGAATAGGADDRDDIGVADTVEAVGADDRDDVGVADTVGAVAIDADGHVAAAASTGGMRLKWPGRVGDTPLIGSGAYADDRLGAASCTGHGERIMRVCMAYSACLRLDEGVGAQEAAEAALGELEERTQGQAGIILVGRDGSLGWAWNTDSMPYAWRDDSGHGEDM